MPKGGMCKHPFGGHSRLDRLNFMDGLAADIPAEKIIYLQTITDAIHNYLFFGLGENGTTIEEFAYACRYLFFVRASQPSTWEGCETMEFVTQDDESGKRNLTTVHLNPAQVRAMCFDTHYSYAGLSDYMPMDRFLNWLRDKRERVLRENQEQVDRYLTRLYSQACEEAAPGQQLPLLLTDRMATLIHPASMREVATLAFLPKQYLRT